MISWTIVRLGVGLHDLYRQRVVRRRPGDCLLLLGLLLLAVRAWGLEFYRVSSSSMEPTLIPGEIFLAVKRPLWRGPVQRGEVVVFHSGGAGITELVKRVAAVSGERLTLTGDGVFVNNRVVWQPSESGSDGGRMLPVAITVPDRGVFVLGDNLQNSVDSRVFGPVSEVHVYGRALLRVYPLSRWGWL